MANKHIAPIKAIPLRICYHYSNLLTSISFTFTANPLLYSEHCNGNLTDKWENSKAHTVYREQLLAMVCLLPYAKINRKIN